MKNLSLFTLIILAMSGCYLVDTNTTYNKSLTSAKSSSEPIYLTFKDSKKASFYFTLEHSMSSKDYLLNVRWHNHSKEPLFDGMNSTLKFLVDGYQVITLKPIKLARLVSYNIETKGHVEETTYLLNYEQLHTLAYAKNVHVELTGKNIIVNGRFNRIQTFRAFKDFARNG